MVSEAPTSNLRLAEARDIVASGTSGKSLPVIEFMDAQQAEIERLDGLWRTEKARADFNFEENERLRAALERYGVHLEECARYGTDPNENVACTCGLTHETCSPQTPAPLAVGPAMIRDTVEWLANNAHGMGAAGWDLHSNRLLALAAQMERSGG